MYIMFSKTMEFCNKGMVRADPPPPVMVKDHKITVFFWDPSLREITVNKICESVNLCIE